MPGPVFAALFTIAGSLPGCVRNRGWLWLAIVAMALFQGLYGLISLLGATTIFGFWERHNVDFVHGSFSNSQFIRRLPGADWRGGGGMVAA